MFFDQTILPRIVFNEIYTMNLIPLAKIFIDFKLYI